MGWMRNPKVAVVLIILAVLALGFMFKSTLFPPKSPVLVKCSDKACGHVDTLQLTAGTVFPVVCPKCKKQTARQATKYFDPKQKKEIVILPDEMVPGAMVPGGEK
jgi:hypothetical protein